MQVRILPRALPTLQARVCLPSGDAPNQQPKPQRYFKCRHWEPHELGDGAADNSAEPEREAHHEQRLNANSLPLGDQPARSPKSVSGSFGELDDAAAVRVHHVDIQVAAAESLEGDLLAVGRPRGRGIAGAALGQLGHATPVYVHHVDVSATAERDLLAVGRPDGSNSWTVLCVSCVTPLPSALMTKISSSPSRMLWNAIAPLRPCPGEWLT